MKKLLAFFRNIIKRIFFKKVLVIRVYVHYSSGDDDNSGLSRDRPKKTIASALAAANAYSPDKKNQVNIVLMRDYIHNIPIIIDKK